MAGFSPSKDPEKRARRGLTARQQLPQVALTFTLGEQPDLPDLVTVDGEPYQWHRQTEVWWAMWTESAQAETFTDTDWSFLLDTAMIHSEFWHSFGARNAIELRLRVSKFGVTPEDRARLRMVFADAEEKEERTARSSSSPKPSTGGFNGLALVGEDG